MSIKHNVAKAGLVIGLATLVGCSSTTGQVRTDNTLTNQVADLNKQGEAYQGPRYKVGILGFGNNTRVKALGGKAENMLRTLLSDAGLDPVFLTKAELAEQERLTELQLTGVTKAAEGKDLTEGFDPIDFRVSGAITSYSETEEGSSILVGGSKTQVAKVGVDYALVDPVSGKTIASKSGLGEYRKKTGGALGFGTSSSGDLSLRDGALRDALAKATSEILKTLSNVPFTGSIVSVDEGVIIFKAGSDSRLSEGTKLEVISLGDEILDPSTGAVLGRKQRVIGKITLDSHMNNQLSESKARLSGDAQIGDLIRVIK